MPGRLSCWPRHGGCRSSCIPPSCRWPDYPPEYANPVDRWVSAAVLRVVPARTRQRMRAEGDLRGVVRGLDPHAGVPGLSDWECVPTPGHTPGHVAFYRRSDRVLITGAAVLTMNPNS